MAGEEEDKTGLDESSKGDEGKGADEDYFQTALDEGAIDPELLAGDTKGKDEGDKKDDAKPPEPSAKEKDLQAQLDRLSGDKKNLQRALHEERQSKKVAKETEGVTLTDAELVKILEEHKDDPAVLLNAVKYQVKQMMKVGNEETVNEVEVKQKKGQLDGVLRERYGEALDDSGSEIRSHIDKAKSYLGLDDHPYGDALGAAAAVFMALPNLLKEAEEKGRKAGLEGKTEKSRQDSIKGRGLGVGKGGNGDGRPPTNKAGLTESEMETAKNLGFVEGSPKFKIYQSQILRRREVA